VGKKEGKAKKKDLGRAHVRDVKILQNQQTKEHAHTEGMSQLL